MDSRDLNRETVGYTTDGMVFMIVNSSMDGKLCQTMLMWEPSEAIKIIEKIEMAIQGIRDSKKEQIQ